MAGGVTVTQFADVLKVPVEKLLEQLAEAGLDIKDADALIDDDSKMVLLNHLRRSHGHEEKDVSAPTKITLNRRARSELKVSGSQGRSRKVTVEVRKKRTYVKRDVIEEQNRQQQEEIEAERRAEEEARQEAEKAEEERIAARKAQKEAEEKAREEEEARKDAEREERLAEARKKEEEALQRQIAEKQAAEQSAAKPAADAKKADAKGKADKGRRGGKGGKDTRYGRSELHVSSDMRGKRRITKGGKRRRSSSVNVDTQHGFQEPTAPVVRDVKVSEGMTVAALAQSMAIKGNEVIKALMNMGMMATINQPLDQDTAFLIVEELGHNPVALQESELDEQIIGSVKNEGEAVSRPPVVTIMGHVDHGKTSLLDYIRSTKVASGEAGGITQHIGAYMVETEQGKVSFLDTPGHAAFTAMRARGAQVTDIVILVVAADDGVKPQTKEAVQHAKAAEVPMVVAINKCDKPEADPDRVKNELAALEVVPEDWGGDYQFVNVSAHTGEGIDELLSACLLQAEVLELTAVAEGNASGVVIESSLEKGRGSVATVLVTSGELKQGDIMVAGEVYGRVRKMIDDTGADVKTAGPSTPVAVLGLSGTPVAGDDVVVLEDERKAREVAEFRHTRARDVKLAQQKAAKLEDMFGKVLEGEQKSVQILVKADVHGSAEALRDSLHKLTNDEVEVKVISAGVGGITESDVNLAAASNAIIIGFNVRADGTARDVIKEHGIDVHYFSIIYEAIDVVKAAVSGLLAPEIKEEIVGLAEVRDVFRSPKFGDIAGCLVVEGFVKRDNPIRVLRDSVVIYEGELESLRRFKDDVNKVESGVECGIGVKDYNDVQAGDQIECFERIEVARTLD